MYIYIYVYNMYNYLLLLEFDLAVGILLIELYFSSRPDSWYPEVFSNPMTWYDLLET